MRSANRLNENKWVIHISMKTSISRPVLVLPHWPFRFFRPVFQSYQNLVGVLMISSVLYNGYLLFSGGKAAAAWR
jgi:hypothetical protein